MCLPVAFLVITGSDVEDVGRGDGSLAIVWDRRLTIDSPEPIPSGL